MPERKNVDKKIPKKKRKAVQRQKQKQAQKQEVKQVVNVKVGNDVIKRKRTRREDVKRGSTPQVPTQIVNPVRYLYQPNQPDVIVPRVEQSVLQQKDVKQLIPEEIRHARVKALDIGRSSLPNIKLLGSTIKEKEEFLSHLRGERESGDLSWSPKENSGLFQDMPSSPNQRAGIYNGTPFLQYTPYRPRDVAFGGGSATNPEQAELLTTARPVRTKVQLARELRELGDTRALKTLSRKSIDELWDLLDRHKS
jgi:hypothetical protein